LAFFGFPDARVAYGEVWRYSVDSNAWAKGSILKKSISAENFSYKFSSSNFGQNVAPKRTDTSLSDNYGQSYWSIECILDKKVTITNLKMTNQVFSENFGRNGFHEIDFRTRHFLSEDFATRLFRSTD
jgi:hypothetical protein